MTNTWGQTQGVLDKCKCAVPGQVRTFYLGTTSLVLLLATVQHGHIITLLCSRRPGHTTGHTGRLERGGNDSVHCKKPKTVEYLSEFHTHVVSNTARKELVQQT